MPFDIGALGMAGAETAANTVLGMALQRANDKRQLRQQEKLSKQQMGFDMQMTDYQFSKQLQMWKDTNYHAQMEQLKKAGLNPGLLYGMSGGGGTTTGGGAAHVGGAQAPTGGGEIMGMMSNRLNLGLIQAQKENIEAQTANLNAQTAKTKGPDTELAQTQIKSLTQGVENQKAQEHLTRAQTALAEIQTAYQAGTLNDAMDMVAYNTRKAMEEWRQAQNQTYISQQTRDKQIEIIGNEAVAGVLRNALLREQKNLTKAQIDQINNDIWATVEGLKIEWGKLDQGDTHIVLERKKIDIQKMVAEFQTKHPQMGQVLGGLLEADFQGIIDKIMQSMRAK